MKFWRHHYEISEQEVKELLQHFAASWGAMAETAYKLLEKGDIQEIAEFMQDEELLFIDDED